MLLTLEACISVIIKDIPSNKVDHIIWPFICLNPNFLEPTKIRHILMGS